MDLVNYRFVNVYPVINVFIPPNKHKLLPRFGYHRIYINFLTIMLSIFAYDKSVRNALFVFFKGVCCIFCDSA